MEQQRQEWTRSPLTRPGGDKRCSAGREHRCQRAHALCLHIHRVRLLACRSSTALVVKTPCFLPPTSDTVQNRLQKHAGQRGSPRPRRRAPHGAQPDLLPFVSYYFTIRSRNGWQSVRTTTGGKNLLTRQRKRSVKALFFFFFFRWPQTRSKSASAAFGLEPSDAFQVWKTSPITDSGCYTDPRSSTTWSEQTDLIWRLQWETAQIHSTTAPSEVAFTDPGPSPRRRVPAVISAQS